MGEAESVLRSRAVVHRWVDEPDSLADNLYVTHGLAARSAALQRPGGREYAYPIVSVIVTEYGFKFASAIDPE
jgi:hypothetical protein